MSQSASQMGCDTWLAVQ